MAPPRVDKRHPHHPQPRGAVGVRLAATRQVLGDRRRANQRLRRSMWFSLLFHGLVVLLVVPLALPGSKTEPSPDPVAEAPPLRVELITLPEHTPAPSVPKELAKRTPDPDREPPIETSVPPVVELDQPPVPEPPAQPQKKPTERLEFLRAHHDASDDVPTDTARISTQDQRVDQDRASPAKARVADGSADRGQMAGSPQQAVRAGAQAQLPAPATPLEHQAEAQARRAASKPLPPRAKKPTEHEQPCQPGSAQSPCDAVADARGTQQGRHDDGQRQRYDGFQLASYAAQQAAVYGERGDWNPIAVRMPGQVVDAQPFLEALLPERPTSPGFTAQHDALLQATVTQRSTRDKESQDQREQRRQQARTQRKARPQGAAQAEQEREPSELAIERITPPEQELQFLVEPIEMMRQEREREQRAQASERNEHKRRKRVAPGSARPTVASPTGSQAAAGGSVVSPIKPPPTIDVRTVLQTRSHPLAPAILALDDQLREAWEIPFEIRVSGIVGTTGVELVLDSRGRIRDVTTTRPSGHATLDALAHSAIPDRIEDFRSLLQPDALAEFPREGLRVYYEFEYRDSPVAGVL